MASGAAFKIDSQQRDAWQAQGHEPVYDRGTVRLRDYRKTFEPGQVVTVLDPETGEYRPLLTKTGKPLTVDMCLPERADLALDDKAQVLSQAEFEQRYGHYISSYSYPDGANPRFEPVPNVIRYLMQVPDTYSSSPGYIEVDFDPKLNEEFKAKKLYTADGQTEEEYVRERNARDSNIESSIKMLAESQSMLAKLVAGNREPIEEAPSPEPEPMAADSAGQDAGVDAMKAADSAGIREGKEQTPCGSFVTEGFIKQHTRFCKDEACIQWRKEYTERRDSE